MQVFKQHYNLGYADPEQELTASFPKMTFLQQFLPRTQTTRLVGRVQTITTKQNTLTYSEAYLCSGHFKGCHLFTMATTCAKWPVVDVHILIHSFNLPNTCSCIL